MNINLIVNISFIFVVVVEAGIVLRSFFIKDSNFYNLLFRFISNSFIYVLALLVFISITTGETGLQLFEFNDLKNLTFGQTSILIILVTDMITILTLSIRFFVNLNNNSKEDDNSDNIINQKEAKNIL